MSISRLKYGLSRLNGPIYEDLTFASTKGINFDTYGIKITDTYIQFGNDTDALGPKLKYGDATTVYVRNAADSAMADLYGATLIAGTSVACNTYNARGTNVAAVTLDIPVSSTDATAHEIKLQIDANNILGVYGYGDGAGGATNLAAKLYQNMLVTDEKGILTGTAAADYFTLQAYNTNDSARKEAIRVTNTAVASANAVIAIGGETTFNKTIGYGAETDVTISGGAIAVTKVYHSVVVEGGVGAGADALTSATGGVEGQILILKPNTTGANDQVTVTDGTGAGAFILDGDANFVMDHVDDRIMFINNSVEWVELSRSSGS